MRRSLPLALALLASLVLAAPLAHARPQTTVSQTILDRDQDDRLEPAPGEDHKTLDDLGAGETRVPGRHRTRPLLFFAQMTDTHVVDEESPLRVESTDEFPPFSSAYRPQEGLSPQVLEEMVDQLRNTVSPVTQDRLDLVMTTGDNTDNTQCNETRWMIDIMDGDTTVNPDSGLLAGEERTASSCPSDPRLPVNTGLPIEFPPLPEAPEPQPCDVRATADDRYDGVRGGGRYYDPDESGEPDSDGPGYAPENARNSVRDFPGLFQRMNEPFRATGFDDIPWYAVFGNHDGLIQGNQPRNPAFEAYATGCVKMGNLPDTSEQAIQEGMRGTGEEAVRALRSAILAEADDDDANTMIVPPDPDRRPLRKHEWIDQHFATGGVPQGHGFNHNPAAAALGMGYYDFSPVPGALRFITLDTVAEHGLEEGNVDDTQFTWLHQRLLDAERAQEAVVIFAHHSLGTMGQPPLSPFLIGDTGGDLNPLVHYGDGPRELDDPPQRCVQQSPAEPTDARETVRCLLLRHPSVIAFVNGHEHKNRIDAVSGGPTQHGFWEINTASHIDWPQQARVIDVVDNDDGTMSLISTIVDHEAPPEPGAPPATTSEQGHAGDSVQRLASISRELSFNDPQARHGETGEGGGRGTRDDRNVELLVRHPYRPLGTP